MDPVRNPFAPGAGNPPPELAGRADILASAETALLRIASGRSSQSQILVGLRGVGKTVMLVKMREMAELQGYRAISIEAHEAKSLPELIVPPLKQALTSMSFVETGKEKARRGLRVLKSFLNGVSVKVGEMEFGLNVDAEHGSADSGDIEADLPNLIEVLGEAAAAALRPIVILIDEMQYLSENEFSAIIMAIHRVSQRSLPVLLIGAGLPQIVGLAGESKSYAERLFRYPRIGELAYEDAKRAIVAPIEAEGAEIEQGALGEILSKTYSYPYFLQQWGHDCWNVAEGNIIKIGDVYAASEIALKTLDESFFKVRLDRCNPSEKRYMRALAELGPGSHRSGDIAEVLKLKSASVGPTRGKLIKKGMIYSPSYGDTAFTVPLFEAFMCRAMPLVI